MENMTDAQATQKKSGKLKILIILVPVLLSLIYWASASGLLGSKSAKQVYLLAEAKEYSKIVNNINDWKYEYYNSFLAPYLRDSVETRTDISLKFSEFPAPDPSMQAVVGLIEQFKLIVESSTDDTKKLSHLKTDLVMGDSSLLEAEFFMDEQRAGFGVPAMYDKYAFYNLSDAGRVEERFGFTVLSNYPSRKELLEQLDLNRETVKADFSAGKYAKIYLDNLNDSQITMNPKAVFSREGTIVNCTEIIITFTEEEFKKLMNQLTRQLAQDDELVNHIYTSYHQWSYASAGNTFQFTDRGLFSKEEIKEALKEFSITFLDYLENMKLEQGVKMNVYLDSTGNMMGRDLTAPALDIRTAWWTSAENAENTLFLLRTEGEKGQVFNYKSAAASLSGDTTGSLEIELTDVDEGTARLLSVFNIENQGKETSFTVNFNLTVDGDFARETALPSEETLTGQVEMNSSEDMSKKERATDFTLKFNAPMIDPAAIVSLQINTREQFGVEVKLPDLNNANSVDIANVSDDELIQLKKEVEKALQDFIMRNMGMFPH